jgi:hypothetical protein
MEQINSNNEQLHLDEENIIRNSNNQMQIHDNNYYNDSTPWPRVNFEGHNNDNYSNNSDDDSGNLYIYLNKIFLSFYKIFSYRIPFYYKK